MNIETENGYPVYEPMLPNRDSSDLLDLDDIYNNPANVLNNHQLYNDGNAISNTYTSAYDMPSNKMDHKDAVTVAFEDATLELIKLRKAIMEQQEHGLYSIIDFPKNSNELKAIYDKYLTFSTDNERICMENIYHALKVKYTSKYGSKSLPSLAVLVIDLLPKRYKVAFKETTHAIITELNDRITVSDTDIDAYYKDREVTRILTRSLLGEGSLPGSFNNTNFIISVNTTGIKPLKSSYIEVYNKTPIAMDIVFNNIIPGVDNITPRPYLVRPYTSFSSIVTGGLKDFIKPEKAAVCQMFVVSQEELAQFNSELGRLEHPDHMDNKEYSQFYDYANNMYPGKTTYVIRCITHFNPHALEDNKIIFPGNDIGVIQVADDTRYSNKLGNEPGTIRSVNIYHPSGSTPYILYEHLGNGIVLPRSSQPSDIYKEPCVIVNNTATDNVTNGNASGGDVYIPITCLDELGKFNLTVTKDEMVSKTSDAIINKKVDQSIKAFKRKIDIDTSEKLAASAKRIKKVKLKNKEIKRKIKLERNSFNKKLKEAKLRYLKEKDTVRKLKDTILDKNETIQLLKLKLESKETEHSFKEKVYEDKKARVEEVDKRGIIAMLFGFIASIFGAVIPKYAVAANVGGSMINAGIKPNLSV